MLLVRLQGALLGVPAADDYNYIHHALFEQPVSWWDGGGASVYWRPLGRQGYFTTVTALLLTRAGLVAAGHLACLCLASGLFYRTFRPSLGSVTAFAVSTGPWLMDSGRLLITWPSCFQDLGALLFVAIAYSEASAGRAWTCATAGLAGVLCKEVAAIPLACLPLCPVLPSTRRMHVTRALGVVLTVWLAAYLVVATRHSLLPASGAWASDLSKAFGAGTQVFWWSLIATVGVSPSGGLVAAIVGAAIVLCAPWKQCHRLLAPSIAELRGWWIWAALWTAPLILALVPLWPGWGAYRIPLTVFGLVTALTVTLQRLHRVAVPAFLAVRCGAFLLAPSVATQVTIDPADYRATIDVPRLTRLQRFVTDVHEALEATHPSLPPRTAVVWEQFPAMTEFGFADAAAVQVWYRDTTLRWIPLRAWIQEGRRDPAVIVEYQPLMKPGAAIVSTEAMRALLDGDDALQRGADSLAATRYVVAMALQGDRRARVFLKTAEGKREFALAKLAVGRGDHSRAREHVKRVLALYPRDVPSVQLLQSLDRAVPGRR